MSVVEDARHSWSSVPPNGSNIPVLYLPGDPSTNLGILDVATAPADRTVHTSG